MNQPAFKFPDEQEAVKDEDKKDALEVEVVDDTPPEDRGREPLPKEVVKELEDDDLEEYSEKVQRRLKQMKKVWHDERREKEAAQREREEALRFALVKDSEIKKLQQELGTGRQIYFDEITKAAETELISVKDRVKQAYESGDPALIADAQEALTDVKVKLQTLKFQQPPLQARQTGVEAQPQYQETRQVSDLKAEAWRSKNTWFGVDEEMTSLALGLHNKLVRQGVDPRSNEYYSRVDETMRKRFPDYFDEESNEESGTRPAVRDRPEPRKAATVVAPATRSTAPKKVRLTQTQLALAKRLGITPEAYAQEIINLETQNG